VNDERKRVLFVCIGNACRSQMAEAFARAYGSDVLVPASAGLAPTLAIPADTVRAMQEKSIDLRDHFPKSIRHLGKAEFDLLVNLSGIELTANRGGKVVQWEVEDPLSLSYKRHCQIRDQIEQLVMDRVLELRRESHLPRFRSLHHPR